jgi:type IV secretion system protein VirB9
MRKLILLLCCIIMVVNNVYAKQNPRGLATDTRIKVVAYDQNNVVTIHGSHFVSTAIYFGKSETILHVDIGDLLAWKASPSKDIPYAIFIEPQLPQSDTNMTVITNKRTYQFQLITRTDDTSRSHDVIYALQFKYPDEEKNQFEGELNNLQRSFLGNSVNDAVHWNYDYSFYGSKRIAPVQAVDNGTYTIFKFAKHEAVPAIFAVDAHQNESLVNFRVEGDYVFVQGVRHQYTFRNGDEVTTVYNDSFSIY